MTRQELMDEFADVLSSVRSRTYPYKARPKQKRNWALYDEAQEHEYPEVVGLIRDVVDEAANSYRLVRHDATGKSGYFADDIAKMLLAQQYEGRSDRVTVGYLSLVGRYLGISNYTGYKTPENAYSDYDIMAILNDAFFITQQPVIMAEHKFGIDGTCFNTTIKANWESAKDQILGCKGRKKQFEKAVLTGGTTFKVISSFAVTHSPTASESPYLRPLFNQISLIKELFHPLRVAETRLSAFWINIMRRYRRNVLSEEQIKWIIKQKGKMKNRDIAEIQSISVRRVQQIYSMYRKSWQVPQLKKAGRHKTGITENEKKVIIDAYNQTKSCACYLEHFIMNKYGLRVNHMKIQSVLKQEGLSMENSRPFRKRKWVRYGREHSNSLWHVDWHEIKDPRWKGLWLIVYEDDSSRLIVGYGIYPTLTSEFSVDVLKMAIEKYGKPEQILSDHGTTFYAVETDHKEKGFTEFEKFLMKEKIAFIVGRVDHPQRL